MADFVETAVTFEKEIEKRYDLRRFNQFIFLCNVYHMDRCEHDSCENFDFIIKLENIYFKHYPDELNGTDSLKNFCRKFHGNFSFLTSLLKILSSMEKEKVKLELQFK